MSAYKVVERKVIILSEEIEKEEKEYFIVGSLNEEDAEEITSIYKIAEIGQWARELARRGKNTKQENSIDKKIDKNLYGNDTTVNEENWSGC